MINSRKLFARFQKNPKVAPKTPEEIKAEQDAIALVDAIERSGEAEKIIYGE